MFEFFKILFAKYLKMFSAQMAKPKVKHFVALTRLDKPVGFLLLFWPCAWGVLLASGKNVAVSWLVVLFIGSVIMRSAGCVINDLIDRNLDSKVARTAKRPLASGDVTIVEAIALLAVLLLLGMLIWLILPERAQIFALFGAGVMVIYPFMKRVIFLPQLVLGIAFNVGTMVGYFAAKGIGAGGWYLYFAGICWTIFYDTIYAYQDYDDDQQAGVKSSALLFGEDGEYYLEQFAKFIMLTFVLAGLVAGMRAGYYLGLVLAGLHLWWQLSIFDLKDAKICHRLFCSNTTFGMLIAIAILGGHYWS